MSETLLQNQSDNDTIPCPICAEPIKKQAKKCIHCDEFLEGFQGWQWRTWWKFRPKTIWELLSLLVVPIVLIWMGTWFNRLEADRQDGLATSHAIAVTATQIAQATSSFHATSTTQAIEATQTAIPLQTAEAKATADTISVNETLVAAQTQEAIRASENAKAIQAAQAEATANALRAAQEKATADAARLSETIEAAQAESRATLEAEATATAAYIAETLAVAKTAEAIRLSESIAAAQTAEAIRSTEVASSFATAQAIESARSAQTAEVLSAAQTAAAIQSPVWNKSPVWKGDQSGPEDINGRYWWELSFNDISWTTVTLPDQGDTVELSDQYYRTHFTWDGASNVSIDFASDDGIEIYMNGSLFGTWGPGWRRLGCVNLSWCEHKEQVSTQNIPTSMLKVGDNVIAVGLTNGQYTPSKYYLSVDINFTE
jgi:hypothetical protein